MKQFHIHLVSDSTGETVGSVSRAALVQFDNVEPEEHVWTLVRTKSQMERVTTAIEESPGMVLYTLVDEELKTLLIKQCKKLSLPCIAVVSPIVAEISNYIGEKSQQKIGKQHQLDEEYFDRVEAINFTLAHDDGQAHWELDEADVVLVGPSRTSKSPTCVYLAYRGLRAANVPYVSGCPLPESLFQLKNTLIVGLTISPDRLQQIRKTRLQSLKQEEETNYVDSENIQEEIEESRKLFRQQHWPIIDVSRRSVEETAATIQQYFQKHKEKMEAAEP